MGNDMKRAVRRYDAPAIREQIDVAMALAGQYDANAGSGALRLIPIGRIRLEAGIDMAANALGVELQQHRSPSGGVMQHFCYGGWEFSQASAGGQTGREDAHGNDEDQ